MKKAAKKMRLSKETLMMLNPDVLERAAGGTFQFSLFVCPQTAITCPQETKLTKCVAHTRQRSGCACLR